jgi:hypothetical protein
MQTWVLVLIVMGGPGLGPFPPAGITTVAGYKTADDCKAAGNFMRMTDSIARAADYKWFVNIEVRCIPGPASN